MLARIKAFSLLIIFLFPLVTEAKIIETVTIADVIPLIDEETWFLVDLDNTTYEGKQALGHTEWFYDKAFEKMRVHGITLDEATRECYPEWIEIQKVCPVKPVEEGFVPGIIHLQKRGIIVMGLTHRQPSLTEATLQQINSLGFNFTPTSPISDIFSVPSITPTLYCEGVLFTGEFNKKGEIFVKFLSLINKIPKKVVFIDDKRRHVEEVEAALTQLGIEYIGVHYTAINHAEKVYYPEIAEFQLKALKTIMSNEAALLLIKHGIE